MKKYIIGLILLLVVVLTSRSVSIVQANPSYFLSSNNTATTTYAYLISPGVGTSTNVLDTTSDSGFAYNNDGAFLIQTSATSTTATPQPPIVKIRFQYSQDNVNWYSLSSPLASNATTTPYQSGEIQITIVTSTDLVSITGSTTRVAQLIPVKLYTKYIRAQIVSGNGTSAVWSQFIATKQTR